METKGVATVRRVIWVVVACLLVVACGGLREASAWLWQQKPLLVINGVEYFEEDYKAWWKNWREEGQALPETPDVFVEWQLMAQEAEIMQLDQAPSLHQKVETFLKVRSLMMLKAEEVDSKIILTDEAIWNLYVKEENPRWRLHILIFKDETLARGKAKALRDGGLSIEALAQEVGKEGGPQFYQEKMVRLPKIHELWRKALAEGKPGTVSEPFAMQESFVVLQLAEVLPPELDDLKEVRQGVVENLTKQKTGELTGKLVEQLKKKYQVEVDEALLAAIGTEHPAPEEGARVLLKTNRESVTVAEFWAQMEREKAFRTQFHFPERELDELKQWVLGNMISQTLISWEALDRHYEERMPLKPLYDFYRRHRMVKEFERRFVGDKAGVTEDEVKKYYEENLDRFQRPEMLQYALLEGEKGFMEKMWDKLTRGYDFFAVAKEASPNSAPVHEMPVSHMNTELLGVIDGLKKGEMSRLFAYNEGMAVVKLIERKPPAPIDFAELRQQLDQQLRQEKYQRLRKELIETLRARSDIRVNEEEWQKVRRQLENTDEGKKNG